MGESFYFMLESIEDPIQHNVCSELNITRAQTKPQDCCQLRHCLPVKSRRSKMIVLLEIFHKHIKMTIL